MTPEERIEYHDQWLQSIESNQSRLSADLARVSANLEHVSSDLKHVSSDLKHVSSDLEHVSSDLGRTVQAQAGMAEQLLALGQHQVLFAAGLAALSTEVRELRDQVKALTETVDRYIQFRSDGNPPN